MLQPKFWVIVQTVLLRCWFIYCMSSKFLYVMGFFFPKSLLQTESGARSPPGLCSSSSTTCCVPVTLLLFHDSLFIITLQWWLTLFPLPLQLESGDEVELEEFYVKFKGLWVPFFFEPVVFLFSFSLQKSPFSVLYSHHSQHSVDSLSCYVGYTQSDLCIVHTWL